MPLRALLYRRPSEPSAINITFEREIYLVRVRRHRQARRYTLRIHSATREVLLTMPPRGSLKQAREFAEKHGGWIAARLDRLPEPAPFAHGDAVPLRGVDHRIEHRHGHARHGVDRRRRAASVCSALPARRRMSRAVSPIFSSARPRPIWKRPAAAPPTRSALRVKRVSIRDQSSRWGSCSTTGVLVLFLAADLRAALRARLSRGARGRPSGRDEPFAALLADGRAHLPACHARQDLARRARHQTCTATAPRTANDASAGPLLAVGGRHAD